MSGWGGVTASEMAAIDENSEWLGVPRALLMENAGAWVARIAYQWLGGAAGKKIVIFCGTGNNGGDGFAAARHLAGLGAEVHVVLIGDPRKIRTPEAKANYDVLCSMRESVKLSTIRAVEELEEVRGELEDAEAVIDGIFGTGIRGEIREPWRSAIRLINSAKGLRIAVDIPSGMDPDTGEVRDLCVNANVTVTFHRPKAGMPAAADYCGELVIAPIGIPPEAEIVMGPGNARQALSSMSRESIGVALLEELPAEALELMEVLGSRVNAKSGRIAYIGGRAELLEECGDASAVIGVGVWANDRRLISIVDEGYALRNLGISLEEKLNEKYRVLSRKASELEKPVYVLGHKADLLIGSSKWKLSWIDRPLNEAGLNALIAVALALISRNVDCFDALAAAGYLAGIANKSGYGAVKKEIDRLKGF